MSIRFSPNTTADLYIGRAAPPNPGDPPDIPDLPVQQYPPFFAYNYDQVEFGGPPPASFFLERGMIASPHQLPRAGPGVADYLVIDPSGARIVVMVLQGATRVQPPTTWLQYYTGRATNTY